MDTPSTEWIDKAAAIREDAHYSRKLLRYNGLQQSLCVGEHVAMRAPDRSGARGTRETAMATGLENEQKELAEFIRAGRAAGTSAFGSYFDEKGGSCALGAVYEGVYHLPRGHGKLMPDHLETAVSVPGRGDEEAARKGCEKRLPLASMIVHLNDDHRLTREQIAEWLTAESNG